MRLVDLIGKRFGRLVVIERKENNKYGHTRWLCLCDCGTESIVAGGNLKNGHIKSCGCLNSDKTTERNWIHGMSGDKDKTGTYETWKGIKARCMNPNEPSYKKYGARGITICQEWVESFETFLMDMGSRPGSKYTIDRIDNNGPYCKDNCRWATMKEQSNNRKSNILVTDGKTRMTLKQMAEKLGLKYLSVYKNYKKDVLPVGYQLFN